MARTRPGREAYAAENVRRQGQEHYLPWYCPDERSAVRPLFPSYLFVRPRDCDITWIKSTFGVAGVVTFGLEPAALRDSIVCQIRKMEQDGFVVLPEKPKYAQGQPVRLREGAFAGRSGTFSHPLTHGRRVVYLSFLGGQTTVIVDEEVLEAA